MIPNSESESGNPKIYKSSSIGIPATKIKSWILVLIMNLEEHSDIDILILILIQIQQIE